MARTHHPLARALLIGLVVLGGLLATARARAADVQLHNQKGASMLNKVLVGDAFWTGATTTTYASKEYDLIKLKKLETGGYLSMITGEGSRGFDQDVVTDTVWDYQVDLPQHMQGCKQAVQLGKGFDPVVGAPYTDTFYFFDLDLFYGTVIQRMYKLRDDRGRDILAFERIDESFVDAATWERYQARAQKIIDAEPKRWAPLNGVVPIHELYGMFIVEPGKTRTSRVTMVNKLAFSGDDSFFGWVGSRLPPVIRGGLQHGFEGSVAIASGLQDARDGTAKRNEN